GNLPPYLRSLIIAGQFAMPAGAARAGPNFWTSPMKRLLHHGLLAIVGPFVESAWYVMRLSAMPVPQHYFFPVEGVRAEALRDSWQAPRDGGRRTHEGIDIF